MEYVYKLKENDSIILISDNKGGVKIKCENGNLLIKELDKVDKMENTIFSRIDKNVLKYYEIIDTCYNKLASITENNPELREKLNIYDDELVKALYGEEYLREDINIIDNEYYCLSTYEKDKCCNR